MVKLFQVFLDRSKGTGLSFGIQGRSFKGYYIHRYHVFDPKSKKILIKDISYLTEKNNKEIYSLELGAVSNSVEFISDIPNCNLIYSRKPKLDSEDVFYVSVGGEVSVKNYINKDTKRAFTRGEMRACEIYLPSTLFKKIKKLKDKTSYYSTCKSTENVHQLFYKDFVFTVTSNFKETHFEKNSSFMKDLNKITNSFKDPVVTEDFKNKILIDMTNFLEKYKHFEVET